jgi:hypothetical protein
MTVLQCYLERHDIEAWAKFMQSKTFQVPDMKDDSGAVEGLLSQLRAIEGVRYVEYYAHGQHLTLKWSPPAIWETIEKTIRKQGYNPKVR